MWWIVLVYMAGWSIHRGKKATGWIGGKRVAGDRAVGLRDWWRKYGFSTVSDGLGQIVFAFLWAAGFMRALLTKAVPAEYLVTEQTGILVEIALAGCAGYVGSSLVYEMVGRRKAKNGSA